MKKIGGLCQRCDGIAPIIRQPLGSTCRANTSKKIHADFLKLHKGYWPVLEFVYRGSSSKNVVTCSAYNGLVENFNLMNHRGIHFAHRLLDEFKDNIPFAQHLGIAHAPWTHGERETGHQGLVR